MARAPSIDLSSLSVRELKDLRLKLDAAIAEREKLERAELKAKMAAIAADAGFSLDELVGGKKGRAGGKECLPSSIATPKAPMKRGRAVAVVPFGFPRSSRSVGQRSKISLSNRRFSRSGIDRPVRATLWPAFVCLEAGRHVERRVGPFSSEDPVPDPWILAPHMSASRRVRDCWTAACCVLCGSQGDVEISTRGAVIDKGCTNDRFAPDLSPGRRCNARGLQINHNVPIDAALVMAADTKQTMLCATGAFNSNSDELWISWANSLQGTQSARWCVRWHLCRTTWSVNQVFNARKAAR